MSALVAAVRSVRDEVVAGESLEDAIAFVAGETGLNPVLLDRKVRESFGDNPANAVVPKAAPAQFDKGWGSRRAAQDAPRAPSRPPTPEQAARAERAMDRALLGLIRALRRPGHDPESDALEAMFWKSR